MDAGARRIAPWTARFDGFVKYRKTSSKMCIRDSPNGYSTTAVKAVETEDALANGAKEIDMVINIGWLKDKRYELIEDEIKKLKSICCLLYTSNICSYRYIYTSTTYYLFCT